jgi:hypothetical protein
MSAAGSSLFKSDGGSSGGAATFGSQLFGAVSEAIQNPSQRTGFLTAVYTLVAGLVVGLILVIIDIYYPFLPINPIAGPSAAARKGQTFWTGLVVDTQNLVVPATASPTLLADNYAVSFQLLLQDSRLLPTPPPGSSRPFRHILHRGRNPCGLTAKNPGPTGHSNIQLSDIQDASPIYTQTGVPDFVNPGFFLDPVNNDLHVCVHTKGPDVSGQTTTYFETTTIYDIPLNTPITIGAILNGQNLEVYTNCRLYATKLLKGAPFLSNPTSDTAWYGRACAYPILGAVQNLTLWPTAIGSSDYLQLCRGANFSNMSLSPVCSSASGAGTTSCSATNTTASPLGGSNFGSSR